MSTAHPDGPARRALKVSVAPDGTVTAETIGFTGSACLSQIGVLDHRPQRVHRRVLRRADADAVRGPRHDPGGHGPWHLTESTPSSLTSP